MPRIRNEAAFLRSRMNSITSEIERVRTRSANEVARLERHQQNLERAISLLEPSGSSTGRRRGRPRKQIAANNGRRRGRPRKTEQETR